MNITSAQYNINYEKNGNGLTIRAIIDGAKVDVPLDPDNRHYAEILKRVADGTLTLKDAEKDAD